MQTTGKISLYGDLEQVARAQDEHNQGLRELNVLLQASGAKTQAMPDDEAVKLAGELEGVRPAA